MAGLGLAGLLALFFPVLFRGETLVLRDLVSFQRPIASILVRLLREGGGLLWNPWIADGQPFAANPNSIVHHPLALLFRLLPFEVAFRGIVLVPVLGSGLAMVLLLRSLGRSGPAAAFGGIAWACSGAILSSTNLLAILLALAPLPAVAGLARLAALGSSRFAGGALALVVGLELAAGEPSMLLATLPVLVAALAAGASPGSEAGPSCGVRPAGRGLARLALPLALGGLLGAATLLPAAALAKRTLRAEPGGLSAAEVDSWSFPPARLAELVAPAALGHAERDRDEPGWYFGGALYPGKGAPYVVSIYGGLLVLLLAATALRHRIREELPWLLLALGALTVAAGAHAPLLGWLRALAPPLESLRYPERFVLVALLALVPPAARGFDLVEAGEEARQTFRRLLVGAAALSAAVAAILAIVPLVVGGDCWARFGLVPERIAAEVAGRLPIDALRPALLALGALAVLRLCRGERERWRPLLLLAIVVADLVGTGRGILPSRPVAEVVAPPPPLAPLAAAPPAGPLFHEAALDRRRGWAVRLAPPPEPALWGIATTLDPDFDRAELRWTSRGGERVRAAIATEPALAGALLERRGVAAVLRFRGEPGEPADPLRLELERPADPRPLVFVADRVVAVASVEEWLGAVRGLGPAAARAAVVERSELAGLDGPAGRGQVERSEVQPGRVRATVRVDEGSWALVAVNQSWDEGWRPGSTGTRRRGCGGSTCR